MRLMIAAVMGIGLLAASPAAAQSVEEGSSRARSLAERYVAVVDVPRMLAEQQALQNSMTADYFSALTGLATKGDTEQMAPIDSFQPDVDMEAIAPMAALVEEVTIEALIETYSEAELEALVGFYETDLGRSILARETVLTATISRLALDRLDEFMAASGMDVEAWRGGMMVQDDGALPTRSMESVSPNAYGMSLNDIMIQGAAEADAAAAAMAGMLDDYDY
jgi:hypothetical protein